MLDRCYEIPDLVEPHAITHSYTQYDAAILPTARRHGVVGSPAFRPAEEAR
jgi:hypothetical protein